MLRALAKQVGSAWGQRRRCANSAWCVVNSAGKSCSAGLVRHFCVPLAHGVVVGCYTQVERGGWVYVMLIEIWVC